MSLVVRQHRTELARGRLAGPTLLTGSIALCLVGNLAASCAFQEPPPPSDPDLRAELGIPDHVTIHRVDLSSQGGQTRLLPRETEIFSGEIVQFVVLDHRVHLVRFDQDEITRSALEFMRETGQDKPPPLVEQGARLVLSFEGAPVGSYPFLVDGNGPSVAGEIRVGLPTP